MTREQPAATALGDDPKRRTSSAQLGGIGVFLTAAWLFSFVLGGGGPEVVRVLTGLAGGVVAPALATAAALQLAGPRLRLTRDRGFVILGTATLAFCSLALVALSFSTGLDGADDARPSGLLGTLTLVFAITSVLAFAASVALVMFAILRSRGLAVRPSALVGAGVGVVVGPLVAWSLLSPVPVFLFCLAVFVVAVVPRGVARGLPRPVVAAAAASVTDIVGLRARVTFSAAVSLAGTLIVWVCGLGVSFAATGTDAATTGLGVAAAVGQLAVVPLLWAATLVVSARLPRSAESARAGFLGATALVGVTVVAMVVAIAVDGDLFVPLVGVLAFGVAVWVASVVWPLVESWPPVARVGVAAVVLLAATVLYAVLVAFSGGVTLVLASGFVAFGGARYLLRDPAMGAGD